MFNLKLPAELSDVHELLFEDNIKSQNRIYLTLIYLTLTQNGMQVRRHK